MLGPGKHDMKLCTHFCLPNMLNDNESWKEAAWMKLRAAAKRKKSMLQGKASQVQIRSS